MFDIGYSRSGSTADVVRENPNGSAEVTAAGAVREIMRARQPGSAFEYFVSRSLRERGYDSVGWMWHAFQVFCDPEDNVG